MYCIAGADGFFGAYIQRFLIGRGEKVLALNHRSAVFPEAENVKNLPFGLTFRGDLDALHALLKNERDIKFIYLIAAHSPDLVKSQPEKALYINSRAYEDFLTKLSDCDITRLYYASSDTVYGENKDDTPFTETSPLSPVNLYGEHKIRAEEITLGNVRGGGKTRRAVSQCRRRCLHRKARGASHHVERKTESGARNYGAHRLMKKGKNKKSDTFSKLNDCNGRLAIADHLQKKEPEKIASERKS